MKKGYYSTPDDKTKIVVDSQVKLTSEFSTSSGTPNSSNGHRTPVKATSKKLFSSPACKRSGHDDPNSRNNVAKNHSSPSKCRQQVSPPTTPPTNAEQDDTPKKQNMNHFAAMTIKCFKCSQRIPNTVQCKNTTEEDCSLVFPDQKAVCAKTIQRFSTNDPPWIFSQCQVEAVFDQSQLNKCTKAPTSDTPGNTIETCICLQQFCNGVERIKNNLIWIVAVFILTTAKTVFE
uniref:Protein sleepless n=1 Tax=Romanomermis culicivorax TaxID=13658 RepID=A0A915I7L4_ROMCU